jgi:transposase InsO family protein
MIMRSHNDPRNTADVCNQEAAAPQSGDGRPVDLGSGAHGQYGGDMPSGEHHAVAVLPVAAAPQRGGNRGAEGRKARAEGPGSGERKTPARSSAAQRRTARFHDGTSLAEKKRQLGLVGNLKGRHLSAALRSELLTAIAEANKNGISFEEACRILELNSRSVYRWKSGSTNSDQHGGGGGKNRITPLEEKRIVSLAKKFPALKCRRIAYELERKSLAFVGKTKVAEVLLKHGLNHEFVRGKKKDLVPPAELLLHEPWAPNLLWGMDWTYLKIAGEFWFLLVIVDWYSRKIVGWGLFPQITRFEVVATLTDAIAVEGIDKLPPGALKPRIVADHGSANTAAYTRENIEIQGLELWLSGVGRATGNARTERTIGTLKREEIHLQEEYPDEKDGRTRLGSTIWDFNFRRPNAGNGGFAPNSVHILGRKVLLDRRTNARQTTQEWRRNFWDQETPG